MILQLKFRIHFWTAVFECPITLKFSHPCSLCTGSLGFPLYHIFHGRSIFSGYFLGFLYSTDSLPCVDGHSPVECLDSMWRKQLLVCGFHPFISIISIPWKTIPVVFYSTCLIFTLVFLGEIDGASLRCESWFLSVYPQGSMGRFRENSACLYEIPMKSPWNP